MLLRAEKVQIFKICKFVQSAQITINRIHVSTDLINKIYNYIANTVSVLLIVMLYFSKVENAECPKSLGNYPYRRRNMMRAHPFKYPSLIEDADVNALCGSTKLPRASKSKDAIILDLNAVYRSLVGFNFLKSPMPAVGSSNVVAPDANKKAPAPPVAKPKGQCLASHREDAGRRLPMMPSKPSNALPIREAHQLPSKLLEFHCPR